MHKRLTKINSYKKKYYKTWENEIEFKDMSNLLLNLAKLILEIQIIIY